MYIELTQIATEGSSTVVFKTLIRADNILRIIQFDKRTQVVLITGQSIEVKETYDDVRLMLEHANRQLLG